MEVSVFPGYQYFGTVLLATDLTAASEPATQRAIELAGQLNARLLIVNVLGDHAGSRLARPGRRPVEDREDHAEAAQRVVDRARRAGTNASYLIWDGDPVDGIVAAAEAESADLIVVGSRGRGVVGRFFGSVSMGVLMRATVPVLVARGNPNTVEGTME
jgi:nucleotide-binding universal stress UspA family protein